MTLADQDHEPDRMLFVVRWPSTEDDSATPPRWAHLSIVTDQGATAFVGFVRRDADPLFELLSTEHAHPCADGMREAWFYGAFCQERNPA